jgi:hypothetical protein
MSSRGSSGALLLVAGLGVVGAMIAMSRSAPAAPAAPGGQTGPTGPTGGTGPTGPAKPTEAQCVAMHKSALELGAKATAAAQAAARAPLDAALASQAAQAAQAAAAAATQLATLCGPLVTSQKPPVATEWGGGGPQGGQGQGGTATGPTGAPLDRNCQSLLLAYQAAYSDATELQAMVQVNPDDEETLEAAGGAFEELVGAAMAYQSSCPDIPTITQWLKELEAGGGFNPGGGDDGELPGHLRDRWSADPGVTTQSRASNVPRIDEWPAAQASLGSSQGGVCKNQPDLFFTDYGRWPIVTGGALIHCNCDPVCSGVSGPEASGRLNQWGALTSTLVDSRVELSASDVAEITSEIGAQEAWLKNSAPGAFSRYLAALYAIYAGALGEPGLDEEDKAVAVHVVLIARKLLESMGVNPALVPPLPFVWVPRIEGAVFVPVWSSLHLFPGI